VTERRFLVLDIETIIDWDLVRSIFGLGSDCTKEQLQQELYSKYTSGFAPPPFHIPICIALIDVDCETCKVVNATVLEHTDEKTLLQQFWKVTKLRKGVPIRSTFITFNGRGFDLPCLFLRSLKHRVPVHVWDRNRYSFDSSHDVCDDLSEFGATSRPSLDLISKLLGLSGKTDTKGSMVEDLYQTGERQRVKNYCMEDAINSYFIWLTLKLIRGEIAEEKYREAFDSAKEIVQTCRAVTDSFFSPSQPVNLTQSHEDTEKEDS
jgi:predicted PolB exonuclease-like 3'-5' exonuclease